MHKPIATSIKQSINHPTEQAIIQTFNQDTKHPNNKIKQPTNNITNVAPINQSVNQPPTNQVNQQNKQQVKQCINFRINQQNQAKHQHTPFSQRNQIKSTSPIRKTIKQPINQSTTQPANKQTKPSSQPTNKTSNKATNQS